MCEMTAMTMMMAVTGRKERNSLEYIEGSLNNSMCSIKQLRIFNIHYVLNLKAFFLVLNHCCLIDNDELEVDLVLAKMPN